MALAADEAEVANPDAEQEAARERLLEGSLRVGHGHGVARVDVGDAGRDFDRGGSAEQQRRSDEGIPPEPFGDPQRREAEVLERGRGAPRVLRRDTVEGGGPDAHPSEVDDRLLHVHLSSNRHPPRHCAS
jgi:hypothetical protein